MVGDALLDIIFCPEENDGVGMLIGRLLMPPPASQQCAPTVHGVVIQQSQTYAAEEHASFHMPSQKGQHLQA